ncbi:MAG TPA: DNA repair protein RecO [Patescibacteria group bacterium]|jgi:DNA repair protein RecO (recombination protein O)|nr:DNA repair protein RecO [Patescibacteria group bacterium]
MSSVRERAIASFILKKQDFGEADQIVTLFSKEEGKVRVLVKAAKMPASKLQPMMQPLFETRVTLSGSKERTGLAKVIGVQMINNYSGILETESKLAAWYVVSELLMRALPDSEPNESLFNELENYAAFLHSAELDPSQVKQSVIQFQIKAMTTLGLGIRSFNLTVAQPQNIWFSLDRGGFTTEDSVDAIPVRWQSFQTFKILADEPYVLTNEFSTEDFAPISGLVNRFVSYQLDREIKSQQLLAST